MIKYILSLLSLFLISSQAVNAQTFEWAIIGEETRSAWVYDEVSQHAFVSERAIDNDGNIIKAGVYITTKDFDPGPGEYFLTDSSLHGGSGFIQKIDADGNFHWAKSLGISEFSWVEHIALDADGNIFIYGEYKDSLDADPGIGEFKLYAANEYSQLFIIKLDNDGNFIWARSLEGESTQTRSIDIDPLGNIIFTGTFKDSIDCDPSPDTFYLGLDLPPEYYQNQFIVKWTNDGDLVWAKLLTDNHDAYFTYDCVDLDETGAIYVAGFFIGLHDFDASPAVYELNSPDALRGYVQKLDSDGNFIFAKMLDGEDGDYYHTKINSIHVASSDNITIGGFFSGEMDVDTGADEDWVSTTGESYDSFIIRLDGAGNTEWSYTFGTGGDERVYDVNVKPDGKTLIIGEHDSICDFDSGPDSYYLGSEIGYDTWIMELSETGEFIWVKGLNGDHYVLGTELLTGPDDAIYVAGSLLGTADLNPGEGEELFLSGGGACVVSPYLIKLKDCEPIPHDGEEDIAACTEFIWPVTGVLYTESGVYLGAVNSESGCDSIVAINLELNFEYINIAINVDGPILTSVAEDASYQWVRCDNDFEYIDGATEQSYNAVTDGVYAVIITKGECVDTSHCFNFLHYSINENTEKNLQLFPNPTSGELHIALNQIVANAQLTIWSPTGQKIGEYSFENESELQIDFDAAPGLYIAEVKIGNSPSNFLQFVKN